MAISAYKGVPDWEIRTQRTTSEGLPYDLNHPDELVVDMKYTGRNDSKSNAQGWERDSKGFFQQLRDNHPEYFSKKNNVAIETGSSPKVDAQFVKNFPQYKGYEGQTLVHHHIGGDGQAVAIPQSMHKGFGEIHNVEKNLGITQNCRNFSKRCEELCEADKTNIGKSAEYFRNNHQAEIKTETPPRHSTHQTDGEENTQSVSQQFKRR